jgi:hypothetical protein
MLLLTLLLPPAACVCLLQLMSSMPLKPEEVSYAPRSGMVNDRGV